MNLSSSEAATRSLTDREQIHFLQTYKRLPVEVDHAEGMYVHTADGTVYLDFLGGIAVNSLGHSHPGVIEAIDRQVRRYMHLSNYFYQDAQIEFVESLCDMTGYARAFLGNSGSEAADGAIKLARSWGSASGRSEVIGFSGGFHGRTFGALSIMDKPRYKDGMGPFLGDARVIPYNDPDALRRAVNDTTCALFVEFLQGEGGIRWATKEFIETIFELKAKHGFLVVADEVQAGGGRTGDFFSFERYGVRPDIVTLAKGVGGGLPLSAILTTEELGTVWSAGQHGSTFGGNAVSCAAGKVLLEALGNGLQEHVREMGEYTLTALRALAGEFPELVTDVRGGGAMIGMELAHPSAPFVDALLERKIIVNSTSENVLRLLPPFIVQREHVDRLVEEIRGCFIAFNENEAARTGG